MYVSISFAVAPNVGLQIDNQAFAEYPSTSGAAPVKVASNTVSVTVGQIAAFTLTPSQERYTTPGGQVVFPHTLINTGNGSDQFSLDLINNSGAFDFTTLAMYADADGNGIADNLNPITQTPVLVRGQSFSFVVIATTPPTAQAGQRDQLTVQATGSASYALANGFIAALTISNIDGATVTLGPVLQLQKRFNLTQGASPSTQDIDVELSYSNTGMAVASNFLIQDIIPGAGTDFNTQGFAYVPNSGIWNNLSLTDAPGGDPLGIDYRYDTVGAYANTLRAVIASLSPGQTGVLKFKLSVVAGLSHGSSLTKNVALINYKNGASNINQYSNPQSYTISGRDNGADLVLSKMAGSLVVPGQCSVFTFKVSNIGTNTTSGEVRVIDTLPPGLEYVSSCLMNGVLVQSGGPTWTCPNAPSTGTFSCKTNHNYLPNVDSGGVLTVVVKANAANLNPPLPAVTAQPNTVSVVNRARVSNDNELLSLQDNNTAQASLLVGPGATLRGRVWLDSNHDKQYQASTDRALPGWTIEILQNGLVVSTVTTAADGSYVVTGLLPAQYQIRFRDPSNNSVNGRPVCNEQGLPNTAANCARTDISGTASTVSAQNDGLFVTVLPGDTASELSLPLDPSGVIYDSVTRLPIAGVVVTLLTPAGFDPSIHLIGGAANISQTTGATGYYQYLLTPAGVAYCAPLSGGCTLTVQVVPPVTHLPPNSQTIPPPTSLNCPGLLNCLSPTGLGGTLGVYPVQAQSTAPALGQPTPYYIRIVLTLGDPDVVNNHIPLDPIVLVGENVLIQKKASRSSAEAGDFIDYTVTIKNGSQQPVNDLRLIDRLPLGLKFVLGTVSLNGTAFANPRDVGNGQLQWVLPTIAANSSASMGYRVRVGTNAVQGDGVNTVLAQCKQVAGSADKLCSNQAQAKVQILDSVLNGKPIMIGKVFLDCNRNRVQSDREIGVPGVRVISQEGTYAITDAEGKYSFYGLTARTHVLKLDALTLPLDWSPVMLANRNAGDAMSRFVDLSTGELHKANFADGVCNASTVSEVHRRRELALNSSFEGAIAAGGLWEKALDFTTLSPANDIRSKAATGSIASNGAAAISNPLLTGTFDTLQSPSTASNMIEPSLRAKALFAASNEATALEKEIEQTDNSVGFLNLIDQQVMQGTQTRVQIKGMQGTTLVLKLNGQEIAASRVGKRSVNQAKQVQALEYIGVPLLIGKNTLTIQQTDMLGILRAEKTITLLAPGPLASIEISPLSALKADSRASNKLLIVLKDANGTPIAERTQLSLVLAGLTANSQSPARIATPDQNLNETGTQVFAQMGGVEIDLIAPDTPSQAKLNIEAGTLKQTFTLDFLPSLRPLLGVGIVEGAIRLNKLKASDLNNNGRSSFDDELRCMGRPTLSLANQAGQWDCFTKSFAGDKGQASLTTALYLKGEVKGEYLLTLAYDNAKDVRARVFRDFSPDEFYPIYGDASERGFDANSSEKLYVRVDKGASYVLYGDFVTASNQTSRQLSQYSRTMTGLKTQIGDEKNQLQAFATRDSLSQKTIDFPANGTSGPFVLGATGVVNSEKVELIVRDRNAKGTVLLRTPLSRFVDYEIEPYAGRLILRRPLASLDADLNPVSVRVVFEQDEATEAYWTTGVQGHAIVGDTLEIGGVAVKSFKDGDHKTLLGVYATTQLGTKGKMTTELARTQQDSLGIATAGNAARLEYVFASPGLDARVQVQKTDANFENASSSFNKNQTELSAKLSYKVAERTTLGGELLHQKDGTYQSNKDAVLLKIEHQLESGFKAELGARHATLSTAANGTTPAKDDAFDSLRVKLTAPLGKQASAFVEVEQAIGDAQRRLLAIGGDYRLSNTGRVYARHEFSNTLGSEFALTNTVKAYNTVLGFDTALLDNTQAFSEYRMKDSLGGRDAQAAIGLRQSWNNAQGLRVSGSFERTHIISTAQGSAVPGASTAATLAVQYTGAPDWKANGRVEWRSTASQTNWLNTLGIAYKMNQNWSALARNVLSLQQNHGTQIGSLDKYRAQIGLAYRDLDHDVWNALAKLEWRGDIDTTSSLMLKRSVQIASVHTHYQLSRSWWLSNTAALKRVTDESNGLRNRSTGSLLTARLNWDVTHRWDAGLRVQASRAGDDSGGKQSRIGAGLELGYMLAENTWLSLGYNIWGVKDRDLALNEYTEAGWYLRLRYKFDETLFNDAKSVKQGKQPTQSLKD